MSKSPLQGNMSEVECAASIAREMTRYEARGPGDMENAWRRLEQRYAIPWRIFWALRYRRPREIAGELYTRLQSAYYCECERQQRKLSHELAVTELLVGSDHPAVVAAKAVLGEAGKKPKHAAGMDSPGED